MDALDTMDGVVRDWTGGAAAEPDYYQRLGLSVMRLPVDDADAQLLRPPPLMALTAMPPVDDASPVRVPSPPVLPPSPGSTGALSPTPSASLPHEKMSTTLGPWDGLFEAEPLFGDADAPVTKKPRPSSLFPMLGPVTAAPMVPADPDAQMSSVAPLQLPQVPPQQQQQPQPQPQPQPKTRRQRRPMYEGGRPEMQRVKRAALNDLFLTLKRTCYGDGSGCDSAVTDTMGRGKRSVNSKDAILRKASSIVTTLRARVAALEREMNLEPAEASTPAAPAATSSSSSSSLSWTSSSPQSATSPAPAPAAAAGALPQVDLQREYRDSSAARFLSRPAGTLVAHSDSLAGALCVPAEAVKQAMDGELSALSLVPGSMRAPYYAALPELLSGAGAGVAVVRCERDGRNALSGSMIVSRVSTRGEGLLLDHVWVPDA